MLKYLKSVQKCHNCTCKKSRRDSISKVTVHFFVWAKFNDGLTKELATSLGYQNPSEARRNDILSGKRRAGDSRSYPSAAKVVRDSCGCALFGQHNKDCKHYVALEERACGCAGNGPHIKDCEHYVAPEARACGWVPCLAGGV